MWYSFFIEKFLSDLNQDLRISEGLKDKSDIPQSVHHPCILIQVIVNLGSRPIHHSVLKVV